MVLCLVLKFSARGRFIPVLTALSAAELVGKEIAAMPQALLSAAPEGQALLRCLQE